MYVAPGTPGRSLEPVAGMDGTLVEKSVLFLQVMSIISWPNLTVTSVIENRPNRWDVGELPASERRVL